MDEVRSVRFGHVSDALQRMLGAQTASRLLRQVGRAAGARGLATVLQEAALIRAACLMTKDPTLGALIGMSYRDAPTLSSYIAANSETLRDAVEGAAKFYHLADPTTRFEVQDDATGARVRVSSTLSVLQANERYQEFLVFGTLARVQSITRRDTRPERVVFRHRALGALRDYERIAGCAVQFEGAFNGVLFQEGALDLRLGTHDPDLVAHLTDLAEAQLHEQETRRGGLLRGRVERMLVEALPERFLTAEEIAEELAINRRTLTRRLNAEGLTYRTLANALRYRLAQAYLQEGRTVTETAFLVGYGEQATFSAAFREWSGLCPTEFVAEACQS